jgi:hypothetical protein
MAVPDHHYQRTGKGLPRHPLRVPGQARLHLVGFREQDGIPVTAGGEEEGQEERSQDTVE